MEGGGVEGGGVEGGEEVEGCPGVGAVGVPTGVSTGVSAGTVTFKNLLQWLLLLQQL